MCGGFSAARSLTLGVAVPAPTSFQKGSVNMLTGFMCTARSVASQVSANDLLSEPRES